MGRERERHPLLHDAISRDLERVVNREYCMAYLVHGGTERRPACLGNRVDRREKTSVSADLRI
jgi:hypothetical protein